MTSVNNVRDATADSSINLERHINNNNAALCSRENGPGVTEIVPFLRQLSDHVDDQQRTLGRAPDAASAVTAVATATVAAAGPGGRAAAMAPDYVREGGSAVERGVTNGGAEGLERVRLDTERQILLTMLLAHLCSEHDATPRTFVEQVLRLYEAKVLDSIQFLFDLGFVPRVALSYRTPLDRKAVVEAVRHQIDSGGKRDPLLLGVWPGGATAAAVAAGGDGVAAGGGVDEDKRTATALGMRILSTSRYLRDFEEEGLIARGSFGDVYRTRHRLDGTRYAIKKVVFRGIGVSHPRAQAVMREVQCLAKLDHKNIVRYHTSWLESSWVENGMGHGRHADYGGGTKFTAGAAAAWRGDAGDGGRHADGAGRVGPMTATARALAAASVGTDESDPGRDASLRARMNALVPAHMQPQLIRGLESMVRSGDSASESGSGWGWGGEGDAGVGSGGGAGAGAKRTGRRHGSFARGGTMLRSSLTGDCRGSMSPQILSPNSLLYPLTQPRERGFSRWSAEDLESETSRWSEVSSCTGGVDCDGSCGVCGGYAESKSTAATAAFRMRGGGGSDARARSAGRRRVPPAVRTLRSEQFRNPSIDMDDLVSFGNSSPTGGGTPTEHGPEEFWDDNSEGGQEWFAGSSCDTFGGARGGRRGGACYRGGRGGRGRRYLRNRRWARRSVSPDRLVQYPVTLYIQMNLCPRDTLQDWLRKRNARLSSEAEDAAGSGVLFENNTHSSSSSSAHSSGAGSCPAVDADGVTAPVTVLDALSSPAHDGGVGKTRCTLASSPRTDPVTSASSGVSDETTSESWSGDGDGHGDDHGDSHGDGHGDDHGDDHGDSHGDSHDGGVGGGMYCPPPSRETSGDLDYTNARQVLGVTATIEEEETETAKAGVSPAQSPTSETGWCEGKSKRSMGQVDLHEALRLFGQLAEGVAHIHTKGIIHRDIKPENVFVGEDDCLKIGDFGLSRTEATISAAAADTAAESEDATGAERKPRFHPTSTAHETEDLLDPLEEAIVPRRPVDPSSEGHTTGVGTASYASPEQLQGHQYGVRSDLFSLGLVLLELCCRFTTTHERAAAFQSMRRQDGAAPSHLAERSPAVARLAELLCRTVPEQRPSAAELLERLEALDGHCGCRGCPGGGGGGRGGVQESKDSGDVRLREELAAKTRKVEEQEVLIGQLQRKLTQLSRNASPAVGPTKPPDDCRDITLDMEVLKLGLTAVEGSGSTGTSPVAGHEVAAEFVP